MSDDPNQGAPAPDPAAPAPAPEPAAADPWARFSSAGIDPQDPLALDAFQWGRDILSEDRRADAVLHLAQQDERVRERLRQELFSEPQAPAAAPAANPFGEPQVPGAFDDIDPAQVQQYVDQRAREIASEIVQQQMAPLGTHVAHQSLAMQADEIARRENLTPEQRESVLQVAFTQYQQGALQDFNRGAEQAFQTLRQITQTWQPPAPTPPDPNLALAQQVAQQQQGSPMQMVGQGQSPGGQAPAGTFADAAEQARRAIAQGNFGG